MSPRKAVTVAWSASNCLSFSVLLEAAASLRSAHTGQGAAAVFGGFFGKGEALTDEAVVEDRGEVGATGGVGEELVSGVAFSEGTRLDCSVAAFTIAGAFSALALTFFCAGGLAAAGGAAAATFAGTTAAALPFRRRLKSTSGEGSPPPGLFSAARAARSPDIFAKIKKTKTFYGAWKMC